MYDGHTCPSFFMVSAPTMLGDYRVGKGKLIPLQINDYGLTDDYLIKSATHNIDNKKELINLELDV